LWASAAAGAFVKVPRAAAQRRSSAPDAPLPPSIAALTSMRAQAKPITSEERRGRLERARTLMADARIGAVVLCGGTSLVYFTGMRWGGGERLFACVITAKGDPFFVCPAFEEDRAREQISRGPFGGAADVRTWQEHDSPYALVAAGLRDRGVAGGRVGVEETTRFVFSDGIATAAPALEIVSGTPVTAGCRQVKDAHELELMRVANAATLSAYEAAYRATQPGMTQGEVSGLISAALGRLGFAGGASVQTAENTANPHGSMAPQVIREGTIVMIDDGCAAEGYQSDITRTFVLGRPTDKMRRVFDVVRKAQDAALAAAKPGVACQTVDAAARKVIVDAGFGPDYKYFSHRLGHGIGMDGHEWPYLVRGNTLPLAAGMTFSDEPGIYIEGEFGVRVEDDMYITEDGAKLFTPQSKSLEEPF
jgi:Xaa-Pro dipeptidase